MSVACLNLLRLAALLDPADPDRDRFQGIAEGLLPRLGAQAARNPLGLSNSVAALDLLAHGLTTAVVIARPGADGSRLDAESQALVAACAARYVPDLFVVVATPQDRVPAGFAHLTAGKPARDGLPTAYVCRGPRCTPPIASPHELAERLGVDS